MRVWQRIWRAVATAVISVVVGAGVGSAAGIDGGVGTAQAAESSARAPASSSPRWSWPLRKVRLTKGFAAPPTPYAAGHRGIDLAASTDDAVLSPAAAVVRFAGVVVDRPVLTLDHGDGVLSSYEPVASALTIGDEVSRGAEIGRVASGGHCGSSCVHVGVRVGGEYVSPLLFFDRVPPAVLLPLKRAGP